LTYAAKQLPLVLVLVLLLSCPAFACLLTDVLVSLGWLQLT
jgi:hypothetical protein